MQTGVITRPLHSKGFGFIRPEDGGKDVFMHVNALKNGTEQDITPGTRVSYELVTREGRSQAADVRIIYDDGGDREPPPDVQADFDWHQEVADMADRARDLAARLDKLADALRV